MDAGSAPDMSINKAEDASQAGLSKSGLGSCTRVAPGTEIASLLTYGRLERISEGLEGVVQPGAFTACSSGMYRFF